MLLALALVGVAVLPSASSARSRSQTRYLGAANKGVKQTHKWWNRGRHWYSSVLGGSSVAFPGDQLNRFARGAELYLNPNLRPVPGFGPRPGQREPGKATWFDDNRWLGLAFLDAYRTTGNPRYLGLLR